MKRSLAFALAFPLAVAVLPGATLAQGMGAPQSLPMAVDLNKAALGTWADYGMTFGDMKLKSRWALVARDAKSITLEMTMEGGMTGVVGGKVTVKMVLEPDPTSAAKPVKELVMQMGDQDPMQAPPDAPTQRFQKPDPRTLVGKEEIKVVAGTYKTMHYRDKNDVATVDVWISEDVPPLGLVRVATTPDPKAAAPGMPPMPPATMELQAVGKGAKPTITKRAKPFDPRKMMTGGARPAGGKKAK